MKSVQVAPILVGILQFWLIIAEVRINYRRINVLNNNACPSGNVISGNLSLDKMVCLNACTRNPVCTGVFFQPGTKQCILCSATRLTYKEEDHSSYLYYGVNSTVTVYMLVREPMSQYNVQEVCRSYGGDLVSVKTSTENSYILESVLNDCDGNVWTSGIGTSGQAYTFRWSDGSYVEDGFTYWYDGQPYDPNHQTNCIQMILGWNFQWNDAGCTYLAYGLCSFNYK